MVVKYILLIIISYTAYGNTNITIREANVMKSFSM